jgi:hypothetical protein
MTVHADFTSQEYFRNLTAEIEKLKAAGPAVEVRFPLVGTVWTGPRQSGLERQRATLRKDDGDVVGFRWWIRRSCARLPTTFCRPMSRITTA